MKSESFASFMAAAPLELFGAPTNRLFCRECGARIQYAPTDGGDVVDVFYDPEDYGAPRQATSEEIANGKSIKESIDPVWECPRCMTEHGMDEWFWYWEG